MRTNPFELRGKKILITGASSGIGRETAIACSKMGASLIITGRNTKRLNDTFNQLEDVPERHIQITADLTIHDELEDLINKLGTLDGAFLAAGKGLTLPVAFSSRVKFEEIFGLNLYAQAELMRLLFKNRILQKNASVVVVSSIGGTRRFMPGNAIYGSSKAALNAFVLYCAKEFAARGIRVNAICPGMTETPLIHQGAITEEQLEKDRKSYPLGRYGDPIDIAYAAIYLLSDAASWVTGQSLVVDGGCSIASS